LNALAPIDNAKTIFFTTGAEATKNAVKVARAHTGRPSVITFTGWFHCPFPITHHGVSEEDALKALDHIFRADCAPEQTAPIVIEPVLEHPP
jgi:4-aminobutyrate aminotransferase / (S)-3-amino-2-methylpropionate transaminase / 5-aminovalerate transaminase